MKYHWLISVLLTLTLIGGLNSALPQMNRNSEVRIIAGYYLTKLWWSLNGKYIEIGDGPLKAHIMKRRLSAILLTKHQPPNKNSVKICFSDKTDFDLDLDVPPTDFDALWIYATKTVFVIAQAQTAIESGIVSDIGQAKNKLSEHLRGLTDAKKESAQIFIGSWLADSNPTDSDFAGYVKQFRAYVEKQMFTKFTNFLNSEQVLNPGDPYVVGTARLTVRDLVKITPAEVKTVTEDRKTYKVAWVGSTLVFSLQDPQAPQNDPTGLGLSGNWVTGIGSTSKDKKLKDIP